MVGDLEIHFAMDTAIHREVAVVRKPLGHLRHVLPNWFCKVHRHSCIDEIQGGDDSGVSLLEKFRKAFQSRFALANELASLASYEVDL